jgi:hypothetical protein
VTALLYLFPIVANVVGDAHWPRYHWQHPPMTSPPDAAPAPEAPPQAAGPPRAVPWLVRRVFPLLATVGLLGLGMAGTIWGPRFYGQTRWALPDDLWGTLIAAQRLLHLDLAGLYTAPTNLVAFPGAAVILVPVVALIDAAGLPLQVPGPHGANHDVWLLAGCYQVIISAVVLLAADATAERLGVSRPKRALLAAASATALWNVTVRWGHPEDAVATGLLLLGILALSRSDVSRGGWLIGAAAAVQPLVLLALPVLVAVTDSKRLAGFLTRVAAPGAALLAVAASANWTATVKAVTKQPNWPGVDHPTPWIFLAPSLGHGTVAAGPARTLAILVACGCALAVGLSWRVRRRWEAARGSTAWTREELLEVLWWTAATLALRCVFEPVMVAYYVWPALAVALITASRTWPRLLGAGTVATVATFLTQATWRNTWGWWALVCAGLGLTLAAAGIWPGRSAAAQVGPEPAEQFVADGAP